METVANWGVRPVFITSTFQDMTAERNWLWAIVAPAIEAELRRYRRHLEWIDLRLGADAKPTETEAEREALVLKVCLDEVRRSRPFLVALIGDRYGWVPPHDRAKAAAQEAGITGDVAGRSVTDLEIDFGVFHDPDQRRRSLFFLRQPLPYATMGTRAARFSDAHNPDDPGAPDRAVRLTTMKERIRDSFGGHVHSYPAVWDAEASQVVGLEEFGRIVEEAIRAQLTAELGEEAAPSELTWLEQEARALDEFAADRRRDFQGRAALLDDIAEFLVAPTQVDAHWAQCLTGTAGAGKSAVFGEILARLHAVQAVASPPDPGASASMREADQAMRDWITELAVTSPRFVALRGRLHADPVLVLAHAAGASPRAPSVDAMLRRWIGEMAGFLNETVDLPDTADAETVERSFASLLGRAALRRRVVVLIDALDQFEQTPRGRYLTWLPKLWPDNARLFATAIPGEASQALAQRQPAALRPMEALTRDEAREVYAAIHRRYHRAPDLALREVLLARPQEAWSNPLWLYLAVEQLNLLDGDDVTRTEQSDPARMPQRLAAMLRQRAADFPADLPGLYRVTFDHAAGWFPTLAPCFLGLIAVGAGGWRESDFRAVLPGLSGEAWDDLRFAHLRRLFRGQIRPRGPLEQWDVAHAQMRDAIRTWLRVRPLAEPDLHAALARRLLELPPDDPLRATETMRHLLGARELARAAEYYSDLSLSKEASAGATHFLAREWVADQPNPSVPTDLAAILDLPELPSAILGLLANRILFDLSKEVEFAGLLSRTLTLLQLINPALTEVAKHDHGNPTWQHNLAVNHFGIGGVMQAQGDIAGADTELQIGLNIARELIAKYPTNPSWLLDLFNGHQRLGVLKMNQGNLQGALDEFLSSRIILERIASAAPSDADWQERISTTHDLIGNALFIQGELSAALIEFRAALRVTQRLASSDPGSVRWQQRLSLGHVKIGNIKEAQGDLASAFTECQAALLIRERMAATDPGNADWQEDVSLSHEGLGRLKELKGDLLGALAEFRAGMAINQRLAKHDPSNTRWLRHVAVSYERIGGIKLRQGDLDGANSEFQALVHLGEQLAAVDPTDLGPQRDLVGCYERIGQIKMIHGDLLGAISEFQTGMRLIQRLAAIDQGNAEWQRMQFAQHDNVGQVKEALGDLSGALAEFETAFHIAQKLTDVDKSNTDLERDVSVLHERIGDVKLAQGDLQSGLVEFQAANTIATRLSAMDPGNVRLQNDCAVRLNKIGDVKIAQGDLSAALNAFQTAMGIVENLADLDASNSDMQRQLSIGHVRIGRLKEARGDLPGALIEYQAAASISRRLSTSAPGNAQLQADHASSYGMTADVMMEQGDLAGALTDYQNALEIIKRQASIEPDSANRRWDMSIGHERVGIVRAAQGDFAGAMTEFQAALKIARKSAALDPENPRLQSQIGNIHERIGDLKAARGDLPGAFAEFRARLVIAQQLAVTDPSNFRWKRGLSVAHNKIGDVKATNGDLSGALADYQAAMRIAQRLASSGPDNADWQRDVTVCCMRLAKTSATIGDNSAAVSFATHALSQARRNVELFPSVPQIHRDFAAVQQFIARLHEPQIPARFSGTTLAPLTQPARPETIRPADIVSAVRVALSRGDITSAADLLATAPASDNLANARAVCTLRLGQPRAAIDLLRPVLLPNGAHSPPDTAPDAWIITYATALALAGDPGDARRVLGWVKDASHRGATRLRDALDAWDKSLTWKQSIRYALGGKPPRPVTLDYSPGEL